MRTIKNLIALCIGIVIVTVGCGGINGIETSEIKFQDGMETSGIKFQVCRVNLATEKLPEYSYEKAITFKTRNKIEAFPQGQNELCPSGNNAFVEAVRISFNEHRPLAISPDMIWLLICQGFSNHINNNSDDLRDIFVNHKGKKEIKIRRNSFLKGNPKNPWENVFPEFCDKINFYTKKDVQNLIIAEFSTTSLIDKTVFQISLMDSMQSYFGCVPLFAQKHL